MARLKTLSRAARLVGVKRTTLQKQIQAGELSTFEGQLDLTELLRVYPQTKIEDSAMIERADQIIERALSRVVRDQEGLPDAEVLATRIDRHWDCCSPGGHRSGAILRVVRSSTHTRSLTMTASPRSD